MKKIIKISPVLLALFLLFMLSNCEKVGDDKNKDEPNDNPDPSGTISLDDPNRLTDVLVIPGATIVSGNMPAPSNTPTSPEMIMVDSTISYTRGSQVRLPISFQDEGSVSGIYFQVNDADDHMNIPVSAGSMGSMAFPIGLPENLETGKFCITISIYDNNGNVSNIFETCISVTNPMGCDVERISGGEGITSTIHDMGTETGFVKIDYETFTVPDRIDVFYGGVWVAGTGSNPGPLGSVPPLSDCSNPGEGYIGDNGVFCFEYLPDERGTLVEVVVSGCVRGGTAWNYQIGCADPDESCLVGQDGNPRFNLKFTGAVDFDLYVKDPSGEVISYSNSSSASGGVLDVDCICCGHGSENIFWEDGTAPSGTYEYWVDFYSYCSDPSSDFTITLTRNGTTIVTQSGNLSVVNEESTHWTYTH
jgi:hypothetical protein